MHLIQVIPFVAVLMALLLPAVPAHAQDTEMARKKCVEFGFKDKTASHESCVKQLLQSTGGGKAPSKPAAAPAAPAVSPMQREDKFWDDAMVTGNLEAFEAYLSIYPRGRYVGLAKANLARLNNASSAQKLAIAKPAPGQNIKDCPDCPEMVVIPAGNFSMGSDQTYNDEKPMHVVSVSSFLIGRTEVTQGQWRSVMGGNPSSFSQCGDDCPVEQVSWNDAQEFIRKLSQKTGKQYRLPSEAEWEYAAGAGKSTKWSFGDSESELVNFAWYFGGSDNTQRVALKRPNAFGLFDMHGNVWEWVEDCWHNNYLGAPLDGSAWTTSCSLSEWRVTRGGSWSNSGLLLRSINRNREKANSANRSQGLRLARIL